MNGQKFLSIWVFVHVLVLMTACSPSPAPAANTPSVSANPTAGQSQATAAPSQPTAAAPATSVASGAKVLTVVMSGEFSNLDPAGFTDSATTPIRELIYDNLVDWDENSNPTPALAKSWDVSKDGLTYTFHLREGVKFQDGTALDAQAVKASLDRLLDPNRNTPAKNAMTFIDHVDVVDSSTVAIKTKIVYPLMLRMLGYGPAAIVSPADIKAFGSNVIEKPVGSGPYRFIEWRKGDRLVVEKNPDYWGQKPGFDQIVYKVAPDASARLTALLNHEAGLVELIPLGDLNKVQTNNDFQLIRGGGARKVFLRLNVSKAPFNDPRVRQAVNYAVDKDAIVKNLLFGEAKVEDSPVAPTDFGYFSAGAYPYDPNKAKQLLKDAGYNANQTLTMDHPVGRYYSDKAIAETVQSYLAAVGMKVNLVSSSDFAQYLKVEAAGDYDMAFTSWFPTVTDADGALYLQYHSSLAGKPFNYNSYKNARVDELLDHARGIVDDNARATDYKEAQQLIMQDAPGLFLYFQKVFAGADAKLKGVRYFPTERLSVKWASLAP